MTGRVGTGGSETSQYPEEERVIPGVVASETGGAQTVVAQRAAVRKRRRGWTACPGQAAGRPRVAEWEPNAAGRGDRRG